MSKRVREEVGYSENGDALSLKTFIYVIYCPFISHMTQADQD